MPEGRSKAQQREETRRALIAEGRRRFAAAGYAAVGTVEVSAGAGVTKGALYHHFGSKLGLFRAVVEQVQHEVGERVAAAAEAESDPFEQLAAGCRAFLAAARDPEVQQVMLLDGPAVLGWNEWRRMDEESSARHLSESLADLVEQGAIAPRPVEPLARLLSGAMNEGALWLARSEQPERDLAAAWEVLRGLLESLRADR
ncbi:TetR/AcrR family transcriptional regulator [Allonocardiopsis opalescens]|uniref:TetR family transcriptional regulator n=1 Tax=Allonocardiopsis opalescens TaxID=1144618 RepID=A0A2T0Q9V6_9ACTN|nr:TetR/AcrR family transcriptional regulator [Allonocardiopsis opalescens]PRY00617.1 TetR family transcriptional regulator [Allonocardiopsis opalescens]